ncbi:MAG: hypothetical protein HXY34_08355 [Candidatus Thorarchaeota archaeon]|nr:hypothetical protein [Candidatus Thorarchaeota archaeon]
MTLPSGIGILDRVLDGGLKEGAISHVYGEAASGKTTFALVFVKQAIRLGMQTVIINSESSSPIERLEQITGRSFQGLETLVKVLSPRTFEEQAVLIDDLDLYARQNTGLVVVDTMTRLYRVSLDDKKTTYAAHRELNRQAGMVKALARNRGIVVIVLNQVRGKIGEAGGFEPVAKSIMEYWEDYSIRLQIGKKPGERVVERLVPNGGLNRCILYLTDDGYATPAEKLGDLGLHSA